MVAELELLTTPTTTTTTPFLNADGEKQWTGLQVKAGVGDQQHSSKLAGWWSGAVGQESSKRPDAATSGAVAWRGERSKQQQRPAGAFPRATERRAANGGSGNGSSGSSNGQQQQQRQQQPLAGEGREAGQTRRPLALARTYVHGGAVARQRKGGRAAGGCAAPPAGPRPRRARPRPALPHAPTPLAGAESGSLLLRAVRDGERDAPPAPSRLRARHNTT
ncbi:hypothetical protein BDY21DRAFT_365591 [Lineolata rhizophorae]|uniref:Uncharacterized protein n=1 Tax=Lineolata rhizophorae TaxID=578093 RepID=A0A6A6NUY6_9PEZI|nr:hypothetical protein BDY21DRAFT_365591 [Lineolata rhizophorae]